MFKAFILLTLLAACQCADTDPSGVTLKLTMAAPDALLIAFTSTTDNVQYSVGWKKVSTDAFPTWVASCNPAAATTPCVIAKCTATACSAHTDGAVIYSHDSTNKEVVIVRKLVGADITISDGEQADMLHQKATLAAAAGSAEIAKVLATGWDGFATKPNLAKFVPEVPAGKFDVTMVAINPEAIQITMTTDSGKYGAVGWQKPGNMYPEYVCICDPSQQDNYCKDFVCTSGKTCTDAGYGSSVKKDSQALTAVFERPLVPSQTDSHKINIGEQHLLWYEGTSAAVANTMAQDKEWKYITRTIGEFSGTKPTFNASAAKATADTVALTVTTNASKYAMAGFSDGVDTHPKFVTVCEPATQEKCGVYDCTAANSCKASVETVTQTRDQANRVATVTFPKSVLPQGKDAYLYWVEKDIPASFVIESSLAQNATWNKYLIPFAPASTKPSFPVTFSRTSDTTIVTTLVPGTGKTVFFGWRKEADTNYPTDAVICAPSVTELGKCLDASCTSKSQCTARATTIYTANTAKDATASITRTLTAGDVKLVNGGNMYVAWDIIDTPSGTTTLEAAKLNDRTTWKYYDEKLPATGTNSSTHTIMPSIIAVALALLYVVA